MTSANGFSNGLALVTFQDDTSNKTYSGFIDTSGKLRNYIEDNAGDLHYENGYIYLKKDNVFTVFTPDGKTNAYELSDNLQLMAYGDGCVIILEHKTSFEAVEDIFHIYGDTGEELSSYSDNSMVLGGLSYMGEGIFCFWRLDGSSYHDFYFTRSNTWMNDRSWRTNSGINSFYADGILFLGSRSDSNHITKFSYANSKGESQTITVPAEYGKSLEYVGHAEGMMLFVNDDSSNFAVYYYDTGTENWSSYQGQYTDRIDSNDRHRPVVGDSHIAICLKGADGLYYTMLLDKNMADVLDAPIPGYPTAIRDGVLYIRDDKKINYYDLEGKLLMEMESSNVSSSGEGIIFTKQGEFLKTDGTPAFSEVDFSTGRLITLP